MYEVITTIHSVLRWFVVILALTVIIRSLVGWTGKKLYSGSENMLGLSLNSILDVQLILGLILYVFLSPYTETAFQDFGAAMSNSVLRFFAVEHFLLMLIAIILVHVGRVRVKKADTDVKKHKRTFIFYLIAFVLILVSIPWPFLGYGKGWI
ncbi:MAG: hypothetical protein K9G58_12325 [Bacteroidales bacterium]|nr:hypothetical protein [Bacteroidales bacterium]MCF8388896.1 hypothetical protein [Bacteroidales bacterium]MCF8398951.1 hypothetical protein [Bacteroidales bacterium]